MASLAARESLSERRSLGHFAVTAVTLTIADTVMMTGLTIAVESDVSGVIKCHRCLPGNIQSYAVWSPQSDRRQSEGGNDPKNQSHNQ